MISVVIPLYNKAHTIVNTLETVIGQSFVDFEVVIVNDGSTDNGVDVIRQFTNDPRIRIITQENQGVSAARNNGVQESKFEYIAFLDGDDEWKPDYLEKVNYAITENPEAGMICAGGVVRNNDEIEPRLAKKYTDTIAVRDFFENPHVFLHTSAAVARKTEFLESGGFPVGMKRNEDYACFFALALITPMVYIGFPLTVYVGMVPGQATQTSTSKVISHIVDRYNHVHDKWKNSTSKNKSYPVFLRYELRHEILNFIRKGEYDMIDYLLKNLDKDILGKFSPFEFQWYANKKLKQVSVLFIYLTKIRWRMHGYPYLGE
ncbi:glycosyltransferase family 2 protein [Zobellia sp. 1_MG-2023]|uniref:glycosyltransferase family 2 protein n=1 Tax=Zobellia sp. 1_MG-2023 TaxID=3062626 RepID=UPI0026E26DCD|nr:glycosyltransferase family 2 protein [Zobellia sp. 1_MG-2023]MDO6817590.1 glycosyltransferase family 2 protein [Zobellia sp. 1_MG-2023]